MAVLGRSMIPAAVTEGERHVLRYVNPAFLELAGGTDDPALGHPLTERFPNLVPAATRALLDAVQMTGKAASGPRSEAYTHPRRGVLFLELMAWPCGSTGAAPMELIEYVPTRGPANSRDRRDALTRDLRDVNERLLVASVREHELAEDAERRLVVAEKAVERSESALQHNVVQTQSLARRLITAQEAERTRLARELHDDVNQQLAGLSIALSVLRRHLPQALDAARAEVDRLQQRTTVLIETIRDLSHELHPGSLRSVGLLPALRHLCAEIEPYGEITFHAEGDLAKLPDDVSLTLYRVAQEALRNVTRHADARRTEVLLTRDTDGIHLQITDDGRGFVNVDERRGLGLLSMEERVLVVNGDLMIDSLPSVGTRVWVRIPALSLYAETRPTTEPEFTRDFEAHAASE